MAENPSAAGAAGLSAASAGVWVGGTEDPLDNVIVIFTTLGITITQHDGMFNAHDLTSMYVFDYIRADDARLFIKVWN